MHDINFHCGSVDFIYADPLVYWQKQKTGVNAAKYNTCAEILRNNSNSPSGYYWLQSTNGSAIYAYCDMTLTCKGVSGGWMQVVNLDMTNTSHQCPPGTTLRTDLPKRLCGIGIGTNDLGVHLWDSKIIGYQDETPLQMHLAKHKHIILILLMVQEPMLMVLVSLMDAIHASTSGLLQLQPLMKLVAAPH